MPLTPPAYRPVLAQPDFRRLLAGLAASSLGDGMSIVAVSWLALELAPPERAGLVVGAAVAAYSLPAVVGALVLMRWGRRLSARRLVLVGAALRGAALGAAAVLHLTGSLGVTTYVVLLGASALFDAWATAGTYTLVSQLFPAEHRIAANSLVSTCVQVSWIVGPVLAGILTAVQGPALVLAVDAVTWLVLAVYIGRLRTRAAPPEPSETGEQAADGFRLLARRPELVGLLAVTAVFFFVYGPVEVALPLFVARDLGGSASVLALYLTVFGVGAAVGGLLGGLVRTARQWPFVVVVVVGWGLILVPFGLTDSLWITLLSFGIGGVIYGPFPAFTLTLFQNAAPPSQLPAVLASRSVVTMSATPLGTAVGGPLVAWLGTAGTLFASGVTTVACGLVTALVLAARRT